MMLVCKATVSCMLKQIILANISFNSEHAEMDFKIYWTDICEARFEIMRDSVEKFLSRNVQNCLKLRSNVLSI